MGEASFWFVGVGVVLMGTAYMLTLLAKQVAAIRRDLEGLETRLTEKISDLPRYSWVDTRFNDIERKLVHPEYLIRRLDDIDQRLGGRRTR